MDFPLQELAALQAQVEQLRGHVDTLGVQLREQLPPIQQLVEGAGVAVQQAHEAMMRAQAVAQREIEQAMETFQLVSRSALEEWVRVSAALKQARAVLTDLGVSDA